MVTEGAAQGCDGVRKHHPHLNSNQVELPSCGIFYVLSATHQNHNDIRVFSAFGFVHKIATFEKSAGCQALIQYTDATTASAAREDLDGRCIPRMLLAALLKRQGFNVKGLAKAAPVKEEPQPQIDCTGNLQ
ncbi:hypothetical protein E2562_017595, partial [Oryza meyeriana var. granulata]